MRIENFNYQELVVGDFVMYKEPHRITLGIIKATEKEYWAEYDFCICLSA